MNKEYIDKLESIKQMLKPIKRFPLRLVIEHLSGNKVIPFDTKSDDDSKVLELLKKVAIDSSIEINKEGISKKRRNEVGNAIEPYVKESLINLRCRANTPKTPSGNRKSQGYPDIEFFDQKGTLHYLECKTFSKDTFHSTLRSFYLSPSSEFKVTRDAHHFIISFEILVDGQKGEKQIYKISSWKILSLENLDVNVKYEFNANNLELYSKKNILAEGNYD